MAAKTGSSENVGAGPPVTVVTTGAIVAGVRAAAAGAETAGAATGRDAAAFFTAAFLAVAFLAGAEGAAVFFDSGLGFFFCVFFGVRTAFMRAVARQWYAIGYCIPPFNDNTCCEASKEALANSCAIDYLRIGRLVRMR